MVGAEDDRVPHERRVADRPRADRRRRGRASRRVCLVELKARFDEHRNIEWARALEQAGVHVVYGFPNLKIHAKTTLVVRREGDGCAATSTSAPATTTPTTARLYEDFGLFTADEDIAADVADLFNYLTGFGRPQKFRKLLVAPFDLRTRLVEQIRAVGDGGRGRKHGPDPDQGERAHRPGDHRGALRGVAGRARTIDVVARSICTLRPGVAGLSETIRVRSVLGRFLEHSRVFVFDARRRARRTSSAAPT